MFYSIKDREDLQILEDLVSLKSQMKAVRLQDKLGKQNFHEDIRKVFETVSNTMINTSEILIKTISEPYINNKKAIENLNEKVSELKRAKGMIAPYLASSLVNLFKPENKSHIRLKKDLNSTKMKDFLISDGIPVTLYSKMLTLEIVTKLLN